MIDRIPVTGIVTITFIDPDTGAHTRDPITDYNLVTDAGKNFMIKKIIDDLTVTSSTISRIEFGQGSTPPTGSDTQVQVPLVDIPIASKDATDNLGEFIGVLGAGVGTGTISEVGLLTSDSPRLLISRIVLTTPFTKGPSENIQINWRIKIGSDPA